MNTKGDTESPEGNGEHHEEDSYVSSQVFPTAMTYIFFVSL